MDHKTFLFLLISIVASFITGANGQVAFYEDEELKIIAISENTFLHVSYLDTDSWGKVACNGLIVKGEKECIVLDTPVSLEISKLLIEVINDSMNLEIKAIVPTHFHVDCLGGLSAFHSKGILSFASNQTIQFARKNEYTIPANGFDEELEITLDLGAVLLKHYGEGHTKDNVIAYYKKEDILFGGCLIKTLEAGKGNLKDANIEHWPHTVQKIKNDFPMVNVVVPGHGKAGGIELLDYTIKLFTEKN